MRSLVVQCLLGTLTFLPVLASAADKDVPKVPLGLKPVPVPEDNPLTVEKIELGKQLYFDPRLSCDDTVSCASCHDPKKGWSNGTPFATGVRSQIGGRSAPTIINAAYSELQFWDGRALRLEGQALGPIQNPIEMDHKLSDCVTKLNLVPGLKLNLKGNMVLSLNAIVSLQDNGLHARFTPVVGIDLTK